MSIAVAIGVALGLGAAAYLSLAWYVWFHRRGPGGRALLALLLATFVWAACEALEVSSTSVRAAVLWSGLKYVGIVSLPPALLAFVAEYTGRRPLRRRTLLLLLLEPVVVLTVLAVPGWSHLIHDYGRDRVVAASQRPILSSSGPLFWPHAVYTYALLFASIATLVGRLARIARPYRRQAWAIGVATVLPMLGNLLYNLQVAPFHLVDPTPFLFLFTAVVFVWGFFRLALLDLRPVARDVVVEQMADGVLVLDVYGRVVDTNAAGAGLLGVGRRALIGRDLAEVVPSAQALLAQAPGVQPGQTRRTEVQMADLPDGRRMDVSLSVTGLVDAGSASGWLVVLRDVTERLADQRRLGRLLTEQTRLADTLTRGLRPQALPELPGIALAARWIPASGEGRPADVSGDFYDVHPAAAGEWAMALGDVSGKGVDAAMQTAMARYTVRTLSAQGYGPEQVLVHLNAALLHAATLPAQAGAAAEPIGPIGPIGPLGTLGAPSGVPGWPAFFADDGSADRFCTMLYARIASAPAPGQVTGVRLTLALGGHPQPLVRRVDGAVEVAGAPGTALGLLEDVAVHEVVLDLAPGDVLLAYTDGVTEARRAGEMFGEDRLAEVLAGAAAGLRGRTGAAAARLVADAVADRVVSAVCEYSGDRDDVTVLVLTVA